MPTVVLLVPTSTYRAPDFVAAARALGIDLVVASEQAPAVTDPTATRAIAIPLDDADAAAAAIVALDDRRGVDAIVALDDRGVVAAARAAERLGLAHNPPEAVARTRDKEAMRRALAEAEIPQPSFAAIDIPEEAGRAAERLGFPVVVKPVGLSGSQGVIRADDAAGATAAAHRASAIAGGGRILVEALVRGREVAVEGLLRGSDLEVLAVFDKPDAGDGPFFEETIYVTPSSLAPDTLASVTKVTSDAAAALGLTEGPIHAELRVDGERVHVLEIAARSIGGLCARALRFGAGISLEAVILRHALGMSLVGMVREEAASGVMMLPIVQGGTLAEVRGQDRARACAGIVGLEITIPPGRAVVPLPEGDRYLGFLFARADTPAAVEHALRTAHEHLEVVLDPATEPSPAGVTTERP
ncbi:MAG: ATP-grasp domain-containing protein [Acidimicrobiia bacterium]